MRLSSLPGYSTARTKPHRYPKNLCEKIWAAVCRQEENAEDKLAFANSAFDLQ